MCVFMVGDVITISLYVLMFALFFICTNHSYDLYSKAMTDVDENNWSVAHHAVDAATYCNRAHKAAEQLIPRCSATTLNLRTVARHGQLPDGYSCLSLACSAAYPGQDDITQLLILHRADVNVISSGGNSPLVLAAGVGGAGACRTLADSGANVKAIKDNGKGAAQVAMRCSSSTRSIVSRAGAPMTYSHSSGRLTERGERKTNQTLRALRRGSVPRHTQRSGYQPNIIVEGSAWCSPVERRRTPPGSSPLPRAPVADKCDQQ